MNNSFMSQYVVVNNVKSIGVCNELYVVGKIICPFTGVPCNVQSVNATEITCVTGPSPPDFDYYPGNGA